ncbi:MAG: 1-(5-phosphoribosyl)-5-[(5-phosphoribosylamino)methylideneamino]imidazole-4-carboxamide isomerase [Chloroflexi bacterium HGW-Chloroflexi-3]|nr:MAG: 1-(5-phosphoribosyl)-5-[(5-phosphoribosylamino)methylideneamino]imidazole-4-carboxamide isomerase [Chloroflexi bacterium HGW-Chloroflexi-3]
MRKFTIYPAIDLMNGNVIRLKQGDPSQKTVYSSEPEQIAKKWLDVGAKWLHIVNLDGAFEDEDDKNIKAIKRILQQTKDNPINIQLGGGLRSLEMIKQTLDLGIHRVILGTIAVEKLDMVEIAIKEFGSEKIIIGIDARDGMVRTHGWTVEPSLGVIPFSLTLKQMGVQTIIYTDISRDGVGGGVNLNSSVELAQKSGLDVIASGGIYSNQDVFAVKTAGLSGVIIGRALYEQSIDPEIVFSLQE